MDVGKQWSLRRLIQERCCPLVFKHAIDGWPTHQLTADYFSKILGNKILDCKISVIQYEDFQWEPDCLHMKITMQQYVDWLQGSTGDDSPLRLIDAAKFSCYIDYKYMKDMFQDHPEILKSVRWDMFGMDARDGDQSTVWIGSYGTYTPCHQDTYGFNLVAQIHGRKRWYLFDPNQSGYMYPTRIPYEESSVYSEVNVRYPDLVKHSLFQKTTPYVIELLPGDVLYVPRHWWHFVESLEPSVSINTWVPTDDDALCQLEESVCRLLYTSLSTTLLNDRERLHFLNTGEELEYHAVNLQYVQRAVNTVRRSRLNNTSSRRVGCVFDNTLGGLDIAPQLQHLQTNLQNSHRTTTAENEVSKQNIDMSSGDDFRKFVYTFQDYAVTFADLSTVTNEKTKKAKRKRKTFYVDENGSSSNSVTGLPYTVKHKHRKVDSVINLTNEHKAASELGLRLLVEDVESDINRTVEHKAASEIGLGLLVEDVESDINRTVEHKAASEIGLGLLVEDVESDINRTVEHKAASEMGLGLLVEDVESDINRTVEHKAASEIGLRLLVEDVESDINRTVEHKAASEIGLGLLVEDVESDINRTVEHKAASEIGLGLLVEDVESDLNQTVEHKATSEMGLRLLVEDVESDLNRTVEHKAASEIGLGLLEDDIENTRVSETKYDVKSCNDCAAITSSIEILAASSLTFVEYMRFLMVHFGYESACEQSDGIVSQTKESVASAQSSRSSSPGSPSATSLTMSANDTSVEIDNSLSVDGNMSKTDLVESRNSNLDKGVTYVNPGEGQAIDGDSKDVETVKRVCPVEENSDQKRNRMLKRSEDGHDADSLRIIRVADVINSILDPGVIQCISHILMNKYKE